MALDNTWEDLIDLKTRFPYAPAWGQALSQGRGNVSTSTSNTRAPITTQDDVGPRARPRKNTKSNFLNRAHG